jgi:hypothetical protein
MLARQRVVLGEALVGVYLFGSAAVGSFEPQVSDVDTVVVLEQDLTDVQFASLDRLYDEIVRESPEWWDRIEAVYLSTQALHASLTGSATAARIAPGEDFHVIQITRGWILDWYQVRRVGIVLEGKPIEEVIPQVTRVEYIATLRDYLLRPDWLRSVDDARDRCYAVLTFCRGLRSLETGDYVSKKDGAVWASATMPEFAPLIASRRNGGSPSG